MTGSPDSRPRFTCHCGAVTIYARESVTRTAEGDRVLCDGCRCLVLHGPGTRQDWERQMEGKGYRG